MDVHFCVKVLEETIAIHGMPEIIHPDQVSQFTSQAFTGLLKEHGIRIRMDGKGSWRDSVFFGPPDMNREAEPAIRITITRTFITDAYR